MSEISVSSNSIRSSGVDWKLTAFRALFVGVVMYAGLMIWLAPHPPMIDLPQHAGQVAALHDLLTGESPWEDVFSINLFTPYLAGYGLALLLSFVMPVAAALKLLITIAFYAFVFLCVCLRRQFGADKRLDWLYVPGFFGFAYTWGFVTFLVAAPVGLLAILLAYRYADSPTYKTGKRLFVVSVVLFFSHGLTFLFASAIGVAFLVCKLKRVERVFMASLPYGLVGVVCLLYVWHIRSIEVEYVYSSPEVIWGWDMRRLLLFFLAPWGGWWEDRFFLIGGLLMLSVPWCLGARVNAREPAACIPMLVALAVWIFVPHHAGRTTFLYERFALFILPFYALMFNHPQAAARYRPAVLRRPMMCQALLALACVAYLGTQTARIVGFAAESKDFDVLLGAAEPGKKALMLIFDANSTAAGNRGAYLHFPAWYQAERRGLVDFSFAWFPPQVVRYRPSRLPAVSPSNPREFTWTRNRGQEYRYYFVRHTEPLSTTLFENTRCQVSLLKSVGVWSLYENTGCQ
ncbi:hypothetical protein [Cupriavidus sp. UYPR2.512]|uniref:hypothetical protein n=1 Tax=Cupriavidus sp. UYPR2.512 TaxID=1080187 RepID=UPI00036EA78E|nr:hypothetical protein [Cupriavidus sp. UYPR2.512]UIF86863.1 hypothetical protein KAF44_04395 [Cupriavidus necator]